MERIIESLKIGDPCPKCGQPLGRRADCFYWRGAYSDGAVCPKDNALWPILEEEIEPLRREQRDP